MLQDDNIFYCNSALQSILNSFFLRDESFSRVRYIYHPWQLPERSPFLAVSVSTKMCVDVVQIQDDKLQQTPTGRD